MIDLGKAFSSFFKDPSWFTKTLVAALFMILSIAGIGILVLAGYFVQITQRVMRQESPLLPRWDGLGRKIVVGFKFCAVYLCYLIPVLLLLLPVLLAIPFAGDGGDTETLPILISIYTFAASMLLLPYGLFLSVLSPVILYRFAERERIGDAVAAVRLIRLFGTNWQNSLVVALIGIGIQSIAPAGIMLFGIGIFFTVFYSLAVTAHMSGLLGLASRTQEGTS